jgi:hypothetical protein
VNIAVRVMADVDQVAVQQQMHHPSKTEYLALQLSGPASKWWWCLGTCSGWTAARQLIATLCLYLERDHICIAAANHTWIRSLTYCCHGRADSDAMRCQGVVIFRGTAQPGGSAAPSQSQTYSPRPPAARAAVQHPHPAPPSPQSN